jgi:hypothetical protein
VPDFLFIYKIPVPVFVGGFLFHKCTLPVLKHGVVILAFYHTSYARIRTRTLNVQQAAEGEDADH